MPGMQSPVPGPSTVRAARDGFMRTLLRAFLLAGLAAFLLFIAADYQWPLKLDSANGHATAVVAEDGTPLRVFADRDGVWRFKIKAAAVSPLYLQALINYEDQYFYLHPGINPFSVVRATIQNLRSGKTVSGASTLTMQVARLLDPHSQSLAGKVKQVFRALQLEWHLSKTEILEQYLELAPFGGNLQGVDAASRAYFGKAPVELSYAQAALLAVLPQAPGRFRPDRHPQRAAAARDKLVKRLVDHGVWPADVLQEVSQETVYAHSPSQEMLAPILARRLQMQHKDESRIDTSIDYDLQLAVQTRLEDYVRFLPEGTTAAAVIVENKDWLVRAYVGSALFADKASRGYVDMVRAIRSPGSAMKPFIYGMALDESLIHSESLLVDAPRWQSSYQPNNFSSDFSGAVSARVALQKSLNVPAVQVLEKLSAEKFNYRLLNAGIRPRIPSGRANLAIALGGFGISMESLLNLYGAIGRGGKVAKLRFSRLQPLQERPLLSEQSAWIIHSMLANQHHPGQQSDRSGPAAGSSLAYKTGTSFGFRDAWAFAVSGKYTLGVWVGRPDGTPSPGQYGAITALPLLFQLNEQLADNTWPARPADISEAEICWPSGLRKSATGSENCHVSRQALGIDGQFPATLAASAEDQWTGSQLAIQVAKDSGLRVEPGCAVGSVEKTVTIWPAPVEPWLDRRWRRVSTLPGADPRCSRQPVTVNNAYSINSIKEGAHIRNLEPQSEFLLPLTTLGGTGNDYWYLDGKKLSQPAGEKSARIWLSAGFHQLLAINESGATDIVSFTVEQW